MKTRLIMHRMVSILILSISLFTFADCFAARGGGRAGGDFDRGVDNNNRINNDILNDDYHNGYWGVPGAVVVPSGGYNNNPSSCSTIQQCSSDGNCVQTQVCN